ncbi:MAG: type II toxin-antitoxin system RelE/ParE family toxin [Betaproteobacteria bacterium]|nr:type II toxin-antitoxin system RelE/ParE family toxin [Betaproteobacteria bacterium]
MARIEAASAVFEDFERFFEHIAQFDAGSAPARIEEIMQAVQVLSTSPLIGRPVQGDKRELVIGRGSRGYVALYRYVSEIDTVFLLAVRSQRESGCKHEA